MARIDALGDAIRDLFGARGVAAGTRCEWVEEAPDGDEWRAGRPSIPPLLVLALALWAGAAGGLDFLFERSRDWCLLECVVGLLLAVAAVAAFRLHRPLAACLALGAGLGFILAGGNAFTFQTQADRLLQGEAGRFEAVAVRDAREGEFGYSVMARVPEGALVRLNVEEEAGILVGDRLSFEARWRQPSARSAHSSWRKGVVAVSAAKGCEVLPSAGPLAGLRALRRAAIGVLQEEEAALTTRFNIDFSEAGLFLRAVLLGYSEGLYTSAFYQTVKVDGLAHLVAVSGAHLVIVCGVVVAAMRRLCIGRVWAIGLQVALIGCYLVITGAPVSAVRAAIMTSLSLISFFSGRRPYALGALSACIVAMITLDPTMAFSLSFLLSAAATLGIVLFSGFFAPWLQRLFGLPSGAVLDSLALAVAATFATAPICACEFGQLSLVSGAANLVAAPVFTMLCVGGLVALLLKGLVPFIGTFALTALFGVAQAFCAFLGLLARIPHAAVPVALCDAVACVVAVGVPLALWVAWPRPSRRAAFPLGGLAAACFFVALAFPLIRGDAVTMLDVGQGDAILVQSGGHAMLIDTGTQDTLLLEGLGSCGALQLDAVLVTHPDDDHCGSLPALRGVVAVGKVLVAHDLLSEDNVNCAKLRREASALVGEEGIVGLSAGDAIQVGKLRFTVAGPDSFADGGGNADSLVLWMEADVNDDDSPDCTALFCGDAEAEQLNAYRAKGLIGEVDLYKVGHHGSRAAVDAGLALALSPSVSLVSVGEGNRYGHPVESTLGALEEAGSRIYRTDLSGKITCSLRADGILVKTER